LPSERGNDLSNGEQGQRGVQEAQTGAQSEDGVAGQDDLPIGEEREEGILRRVGFWTGAQVQLSHKTNLIKK